MCSSKCRARTSATTSSIVHFYRWHGVHVRERHFGTGGLVDLQEFGWYVADCADCQAGKMDLIVDLFVEATEAVYSQRKAETKSARGGKNYGYQPPKPAKAKSSFRLSKMGRSRKKVAEPQDEAAAESATLRDAATSEQALADALATLMGEDQAISLLLGAAATLQAKQQAAAAWP